MDSDLEECCWDNNIKSLDQKRKVKTLSKIHKISSLGHNQVRLNSKLSVEIEINCRVKAQFHNETDSFYT